VGMDHLQVLFLLSGLLLAVLDNGNGETSHSLVGGHPVSLGIYP